MKGLEDLSCTDITQQWGKIKSSSKKLIEAVPLINFCHTMKSKSPYGDPTVSLPDETTLNKMRKLLIGGILILGLIICVF